MEYINSSITDPRWNLALEQYVFDHMDRSKSYLILWQNNNTIVIGKNQNTVREINNEYVRENSITVVRRLSGGGAVYHDMGNLNFTFITDTGQMDQINFQFFCQPVIKTLAAFGVKASFTGRNDITIDEKKISGNAQYIKDGRIMHHGTLMFDSNLFVLENALKVNAEKIHSKGVRSVASRVTNIKEYLPKGITLTDFKAHFVDYISSTRNLRPYHLTPEDKQKIEEIKHKRYDTWEWNYGRSPSYTINRQKRIENCGIIEVSLDVHNGRIRNVQFFGDFFGSDNISGLEAHLQQCPYNYNDILNRLQSCNLSHYMLNINAEELAKIIIP